MTNKNFTLQYATVDGGEIKKEYTTDIQAGSIDEAVAIFKDNKNKLRLGFTPYIILDCYPNNF